MVHLDQCPDGPHMDLPIGLSLWERMCAWRSPQRKDSRCSNPILSFYGCLAFCFSQEPIPCNAHNNSILWHVFPHYFTQGVLICLPFCTLKTSLRCLCLLSMFLDHLKWHSWIVIYLFSITDGAQRLPLMSSFPSSMGWLEFLFSPTFSFLWQSRFNWHLIKEALTFGLIPYDHIALN